MAGIFFKICPTCTARIPSDTAVCECGHAFTTASPAPDTSTESDTALNDSRLMEDYLVARVEQALAEIEAARTDLATDPRDFRKAEHVLHTVHKARALDAELHSQREHTATLSGRTEKAISASGELPSPNQAGERFTAIQAAKAQRIAARFEGSETKSCPQCGVVLPVNAGLCFCSYRFPLLQEHSASEAVQQNSRRMQS